MKEKSVLQVYMDTEMKQAAEELYKSLGTSLAEATRMFIRQSLRVGGLPFDLKLPPVTGYQYGLYSLSDEENASKNELDEESEIVEIKDE